MGDRSPKSANARPNQDRCRSRRGGRLCRSIPINPCIDRGRPMGPSCVVKAGKRGRGRGLLRPAAAKRSEGPACLGTMMFAVLECMHCTAWHLACTRSTYSLDQNRAWERSASVGLAGSRRWWSVGWGLADEAQGRRGEDGRRSAGASASVQQPGAGLAWAGGIESHSRAAAAAFGSRLGLGVVAAASAAVGRSMDSIDSSNPPILMTILMLLFDVHNTHRRALCLALPCLGSRSRSRSHGGRSGDGRDPGAAGERAGRRV